MAESSSEERKKEQLQHLAQLGKLLAAEEKAGQDNSAAPAGLSAFIKEWQPQARQLGLSRDLLLQVGELLDNYDHLILSARQARLGRALTMLRQAYRELRDGPRPTAPTQEAAPTAAPEAPPPKPRRRRRVPPPPKGTTLDSPIEKAGRITTKYLRALKKLGLDTIRDLLYHFPRRYDDFSSLRQIHDLMYGSTETIIATIEQVDQRRTARGRTLISAQVRDETGTIEAVWFNQPYLMRSLRPGMRVVLSGKVEQFRGRLNLQSPEWEPYDDELIHTGRLVPVYPMSGDMRPRGTRRLIKQIVDQWAERIPDPLPAKVRQRTQLWGLSQALQQIHFPDDWPQLQLARRRLAFDEFLLIQIGVLQRKREWQSVPGHPLALDQELLERFRESLPFQLTGAQERALEGILDDLQKDVPMSRLLQGDVGSGKTVVAATAMLLAVANGRQAALMAPTEILAEQHDHTLRHLLAGLEVPARPSAEHVASEGDQWKEEDPERATRVDELRALLGMEPEQAEGEPRIALLVGSLKKREKQELHEAIAEGKVDIVVGTHALIQEDVAFANLGVVVIDEQHRFGVMQRRALHQKGFNPHLLVMTATPIPRTLALTLHGDLDLAVIDEMPPGRQPIRTRWLSNSERQRAYDFVREQIEQGRQAFVICPLVEESEKIEAAAATAEFERLQGEVFPDLKLDLLHGRMSGPDKERIMRRFHDGKTQILVSTPVVEVGIDVPNATVMMVEGAERFGLAQLHQFRGRVGRGEHASYCILLATSDEMGSERLKAIEETQDGFVLAEIDLDLRGPGEFFGTRQSGMPDLKVARLGDTRLLELARREAETILADDPDLGRPEHVVLAERLADFWGHGVEIS